MRKKNVLVSLLGVAFATSLTLGFAGCNKGNAGSSTGGGDKDAQILALYNTYVVTVQAEGETPMSYEEWLATVKGEKGDKGD